MKQLRAVRREVEVKSLLLQVVAETFVSLLAEQIPHAPVVKREFLDLQRHITLAAMRGEVHDRQIEGPTLGAPLDNDELFRRRIARPGGTRAQQFAFATSGCGSRDGGQQLFV